MTRIVGVGGKLAAGKDEIADHLVRLYGWTKIGMSDDLADIMYTLNPYLTIQVPMGRGRYVPRLIRYQELLDKEGYVKAKENPEVRRLLQIMGTEIGRKKISESLWTDMVKKKVAEATAAGAPGVIITGIRFPNEVQMLEELDAESWWVIRPGEAGANAGHASENSVEAADFDQTIWNTGSLSDLYNKVDDLVK